MMPTTLPATPPDAATLAEDLARYRVVEADRLAGVLAEFPGGGDAALAAFLVARKVLTPFQAARAVAGECRALALGPYRLTGVHGRGTLGPVSRATKTGRGGGEWVVRAMPLRSLWQAKEAKKLARTLAALPPHPGVAPLADADSANGFHYLVWPVTPGDTLADRVSAAGPLLPGEVATLLAHLAAALAACHAGGVVHGLLSPHAVALAAGPGAGGPRLLELGAGALLAANLAATESLFDTMTAAVAVAGVLPFAAPEWLADPTAPTPAGDQYALGAVGYFALTGQPPGPALRPVADLNPAVPDDLAALVERLLCPDPADRFASADEARDAFAAATGHQDLMDLICPPSGPPASVSSRRAGDRADGSRHGTLSWGGGTAGAPLPGRDDSDASIQFDLDDLPVPSVGPGAMSHADDHSGAFARDPHTPPPPPHDGWDDPPHDPPPPAPAPAPRVSLLGLGTDEKGRRGFVPPPLLPAAALTHGTGPRGKSPPPPADAPAPSSPAPPAAGAKSGSLAWKSLKRKVLFWQEPADAVRVSVFGPATVARSETPRVTVYLYPPAAADSVATLARAFQQGAVLLGTTAIGCPVVRGTRLAVHLAVANAAVTSPLGKCKWQGQPHRVTFDLLVPWEAAGGPAAGVVSIGHDDIRIGKAEFRLLVRDE